LKTDTEVKIKGLDILVQGLGAVDAERFISLLLREPFDYTQWQKDLWADRSVEQIRKKAMYLRKKQL
jgi:hypothetical protein